MLRLLRIARMRVVFGVIDRVLSHNVMRMLVFLLVAFALVHWCVRLSRAVPTCLPEPPDVPLLQTPHRVVSHNAGRRCACMFYFVARLYGDDVTTWITVQINNGNLPEDASTLQWCAPATCFSTPAPATGSPRTQQRPQPLLCPLPQTRRLQVHFRRLLVRHHDGHGGLRRHHGHPGQRRSATRAPARAVPGLACDRVLGVKRAARWLSLPECAHADWREARVDVHDGGGHEVRGPCPAGSSPMAACPDPGGTPSAAQPRHRRWPVPLTQDAHTHAGVPLRPPVLPHARPLAQFVRLPHGLHGHAHRLVQRRRRARHAQKGARQRAHQAAQAAAPPGHQDPRIREHLLHACFAPACGNCAPGQPAQRPVPLAARLLSVCLLPVQFDQVLEKQLHEDEAQIISELPGTLKMQVR